MLIRSGLIAPGPSPPILGDSPNVSMSSTSSTRDWKYRRMLVLGKRMEHLIKRKRNKSGLVSNYICDRADDAKEYFPHHLVDKRELVLFLKYKCSTSIFFNMILLRYGTCGRISEQEKGHPSQSERTSNSKKKLEHSV